jgi:hypothetical protein
MTATNTTHPTAAEAVSASDSHPFVHGVRDYAERVLRPTALRTEREGITAGRVAELRELGLLSHLPAGGGYGARRVHEIVAAGCFNTWLVWAQHAAPLDLAAVAGSRTERVTLDEVLVPDEHVISLHARSALFALVQGQNADVRRAQLTHLAR